MNYGIVKVDMSMAKEEPQRLFRIFKEMEFLPLRAEAMLCSDVIKYEGWCPMFRNLEHGAVIPTYLLEITCRQSGDLKSVTVQEQT